MRKARAEGLPPPGGRPRDEDLLTRKPLSFWDRIKFLVLLGLVWFILTWSVMANDPSSGSRTRCGSRCGKARGCSS